MSEWNESKLQQYIDDEIEESLTLEYKAAGALAKTNEKRFEITKDVSAMTNSAGGILIYGIKEHDDASKKHLPEKITPINRKEFSKEWLEQVIINILPPISNLIIHPVSLSTGPDDVAYVVEIPRSTTAHQATDKKYYMRMNFLAEAMNHYQILDLLNRQTKPDVTVEFGFEKPVVQHKYLLKVFVINQGTSVVQNFQLMFTFPRVVSYESNSIEKRDNIELRSEVNGDYVIIYRSKSVLFPTESREIGAEMNWRYSMDSDKYGKVSPYESGPNQSAIRKDKEFVTWTLYADHMEPKAGTVPFSQLHEF